MSVQEKQEINNFENGKIHLHIYFMVSIIRLKHWRHTRAGINSLSFTAPQSLHCYYYWLYYYFCYYCYCYNCHYHYYYFDYYKVLLPLLNNCFELDYFTAPVISSFRWKLKSRAPTASTMTTSFDDYDGFEDDEDGNQNKLRNMISSPLALSCLPTTYYYNKDPCLWISELHEFAWIA